MIFFVAGVLVFREVVLAVGRFSGTALLTCVILMVIPLSLYTGLDWTAAPFSTPWGRVLNVLFEVFTFLGFLGYLALFYSLPYGIRTPRWAIGVMLGWGSALLALVLIVLSDGEGEWIWTGAMLIVWGLSSLASLFRATPL